MTTADDDALRGRDSDPDEEKMGTLIWKYLDGEHSGDELGELSQELAESEASRRQFVSMSVVHQQLFRFFGGEGGRQDDGPGRFLLSELRGFKGRL